MKNKGSKLSRRNGLKNTGPVVKLPTVTKKVATIVRFGKNLYKVLGTEKTMDEAKFRKVLAALRKNRDVLVLSKKPIYYVFHS